jgi:hypothetical protein
METITKVFDFGHFEAREGVIIGTINEGAEVNWHTFQQVAHWADSLFDGRLWCYISHRIHSYSVDPLVYTLCAELDNLAMIAIAFHDTTQLHTFNTEKLFCTHIPFECFNDLHSALQRCALQMA